MMPTADAIGRRRELIFLVQMLMHDNLQDKLAVCSTVFLIGRVMGACISQVIITGFSYWPSHHEI